MSQGALELAERAGNKKARRNDGLRWKNHEIVGIFTM